MMYEHSSSSIAVQLDQQKMIFSESCAEGTFLRLPVLQQTETLTRNVCNEVYAFY